MKTLITGVALLLCATLNAQDQATSEELDAAKAHVVPYKEALKLDEKQELRMMEPFIAGEKEKAPMMKQYLSLKAQFDQIDAASARSAESMLTQEQQEQLAQIRKEGKFTQAPAVCEKAAAGKACCAGGKGHDAHGEAAPAPQHMGTKK